MFLGSSQEALVVKNLPACAGDRRGGFNLPLGGEDPLKEVMATSSILAWRIPWTEEPGVGYSPQGCRVIHN